MTGALAWKRTFATWGPLALYAIVVLAFGGMSQGSAARIVSLIPLGPSDKVLHFTLFFGFGWLFVRALQITHPGLTGARTALLVALAGTALGSLDELLQSFSMTRSGALGDVVADACGAAVGGTLRIVVRRLRARVSTAALTSASDNNPTLPTSDPA